MAMEGGGNYRARLAARNYQSRSDQAFSTPPPASNPRMPGFTDINAQRAYVRNRIGQPEPLIEGLIGGTAGKAGKLTLNALNSRSVARVAELARLRAQSMLGDTAEEYARMGMRMPDYSQQVSKAPDVVYDFLEQMIATGAKPRTINRWLKFVEDFDEDAVDALERYGYGTSLWGAPARGAERLYERLMRRVESSVDQF